MTLVPITDIGLLPMTRRLQLGREEIWPVEIVETESGEYRLKHGRTGFTLPSPLASHTFQLSFVLP
jgi:hypothetical protein